MQIETEHVAEGDHDILSPIGELDLSSYVLLRDRIDEFLDRACRLARESRCVAARPDPADTAHLLA
jgi:hypothetical protein